MGFNWYVVRTMPRGEYVAASKLGHDGYEVYLPLSQGPHARTGHADAPLFPGYLFLRCNPISDGWPSFRSSHHVFGWLELGGEIPPVPDHVVAELKDHVEGMNRHGGLWRRFIPGDRVQVMSKTLQTVAEVVEQPNSPRAKVKVLLNFMGGLIHGEVPWEDLRLINDYDVARGSDRQQTPRRTRGKGRWISGFGPKPVPIT